MSRTFILSIVALLLLSLPFCACAQDTEKKKTPIICDGDKVVYLEQEQKVIGTGKVVVTYTDLILTCNRVEISMETKEAIAEGNVILTQADSELRGEKVVYNFETKMGRLINPEFESLTVPVYGKAKYAEKISEDEMTMRTGYVTTCDLDKPHYRVQAQNIKIYLEDKVVVKNAMFLVGNVPIFYFPYYVYSLKEHYPKVRMTPGKDDAWGWFLLTDWRYELNAYNKGILRLDYRERKDFASGFDHYYKTNKFGDGMLKFYYMRERNIKDHLWDTPRNAWERQRYRILLRHRWDVDPNTYLEGEYNKISDNEMLKDYFYREDYERQPAPKSYLSAVRGCENYSLSFLLQKRSNRFLSETEYLPELRLNISNLRLGKEEEFGEDLAERQRAAGIFRWHRFYYKNESSFANLTDKTANSGADEDVVRFDTYNQLTYDTKFAFLNIAPYVGTRQTYYSRDTSGDERDLIRGVFYAGAEISTKFYRIFNVKPRWWGSDINQIRHVITPRIAYRYQHLPTVPSSKLNQFSSIDSVGRVNKIELSLENKIQTKRHKSKAISPDEEEDEDSDEEELLPTEPGLETVDLATLIISGDYRFKLEDGSKFDNVKADLELRPFPWLLIEADTTYETRTRDFETFNLDVYADIGEKWKVGLGHRYRQNHRTEMTVDVNFKLNELWQFGVYERFMWKGFPHTLKKINDLREQEYYIRRDLHCWIGEIIYSEHVDEGSTIWLVFRLKAYPDMPLEFQTSFHEPKLYSQELIR